MEQLIKTDIRDIRKGDKFAVNGQIYTASADSHQNFDESDEPWIVYDTEDNGYFEEDIEDGIITMVAVVSDGFIRDAQVFMGDCDRLGDDNYDHEEDYNDYTALGFIGIFQGTSEETIIAEAAKREGVPPGTIELLDVNVIVLPD